MKRFVTLVYLQAFVSPENLALCFHLNLLIIDWLNLLCACLVFLTRYDLHGPGKSWTLQLIDQNICVFILNIFPFMSCCLPFFCFFQLQVVHNFLLKPFQWTGSKYYHPSKTKNRLKTPEAGLKGGATDKIIPLWEHFDLFLTQIRDITVLPSWCFYTHFTEG